MYGYLPGDLHRCSLRLGECTEDIRIRSARMGTFKLLNDLYRMVSTDSSLLSSFNTVLYV